MGCPHVHGDNPRALASGLSYVKVDLPILYQLDQCRHALMHMHWQERVGQYRSSK